MGEIIKLCGVAVLCTVCALLLRNFKGESALLVRIAGIVLLFGFAAVSMGDIVSELRSIADSYELFDYVSILFKALCIAILSKICGDICKDCGEGTIGGCVELSGKLSILSLCIPLIKELMQYVTEILKEQV